MSEVSMAVPPVVSCKRGCSGQSRQDPKARPEGNWPYEISGGGVIYGENLNQTQQCAQVTDWVGHWVTSMP